MKQSIPSWVAVVVIILVVVLAIGYFFMRSGSRVRRTEPKEAQAEDVNPEILEAQQAPLIPTR